MQPYQQASAKLRKQSELPYDILKGAASLAGSGAIASKIAPLLNQYVPANILQKGLSKISPKLGSFMEQAQDMGFDENQIREFLQNKIQPPEPPKKEEPEHPIVTQAKNFETSYPDVAQALMRTIQNGQTPQAAAAILKQSTPFGAKIKKLEKEIGKNFVDFILEIMGSHPQNQGIDQQIAQIASPQLQDVAQQQVSSQEMQNPNSPVGGVDPKLMQLLQNIQSGIKNMRGKGG